MDAPSAPANLDVRLAELLAQVGAGDGAALGRLYDASLSSVYGLVLRVVRNAADAEESTPPLMPTTTRSLRCSVTRLKLYSNNSSPPKSKKRGHLRPALPECRFDQGNWVEPMRKRSTSRATPRPSLKAQTTRL